MSPEVSILNLANGVYLLNGVTGGRPLQIPVLVGSEGALMIDTGNASDVDELLLPGLLQIGLLPDQLTHILITHCDHDHIGGNHAMKQLAPQAYLGCGEQDKAQVESPDQIWSQRYDAYRAKHGHCYPDGVKEIVYACLGEAQPVDGVFRAGDLIELSDDWQLEVVHLPGHSHGHLGVMDRKNGILFGGDAIQGSVYLNTDGESALCPTYLYPQAYLETVEKIRGMEPQVYVGCHWPVKRGDEVEAFCDESRAFVEKAEKLILKEIGGSPAGLTLSELCARCGPHLGTWPEPVNHELCYAFSGHLDELEAGGVLRAEGFPARYRLAQ